MKRLVYFTLLGLCLSHLTQAQCLFPAVINNVVAGSPALAYSTAAGNGTAAALTVDVSITIAAGTNYIAVGVGYSNQWCATTAVTIVSTSKAGANLGHSTNCSGSGYALDVWEIKGSDIPTGAQTIHVVTNASAAYDVVVMAFTGANATTPSKSVTSTTGGVASVSQVVTCNTGDIMVSFSNTGGRTETGTSGTTLVGTQAADGYCRLSGLYEVAGASDKTISYDLSSAGSESNVIFAVQP